MLLWILPGGKETLAPGSKCVALDCNLEVHNLSQQRNQFNVMRSSVIKIELYSLGYNSRKGSTLDLECLRTMLTDQEAQGLRKAPKSEMYQLHDRGSWF